MAKINERGFSLIEIIFSITILVLITGAMIFGFGRSISQNDLKRGASRMALELRNVQSAALNTNLFGGEAPFGYGVYLSVNNPKKIIVFADLDDDKSYDSGTELVETIDLVDHVSIVALAPGSPLQIVFRSPEPKTFINGYNSGSAVITLSLDQDNSKTRQITINVSGQIDMQ